ncbi:MAG: hypothetical protein Q7S33_01055 [Nanoarchaeota archaeon]|nr:hypothetical protein [Nanoarchaeota archaeon]
MKNDIISGLYWVASVIGSNYSKEYHGAMENIVHSYGHDITLPLGTYFLAKLANNPLGKNKLVNASYVFLGCSAFEIAQGLGWYGGTFDPKDFLAYATGAGLAVAIDKITFRNKKINNLEDSI